MSSWQPAGQAPVAPSAIRTKAKTLLIRDKIMMAVTQEISGDHVGLRLRTGATLNPPDRNTFYGGGAKGYTDYRALA